VAVVTKAGWESAARPRHRSPMGASQVVAGDIDPAAAHDGLSTSG